jgi:hypothetical protein
LHLYVLLQHPPVPSYSATAFAAAGSGIPPTTELLRQLLIDLFDLAQHIPLLLAAAAALPATHTEVCRGSIQK